MRETDNISGKISSIVIQGVVLIVALALTACAPVTVPDAPTVEESLLTVIPPTETASATADTATDLAVLSFAGNGDTFLERIDDARTEAGTVSEHRYLEVKDAEGRVWQGEELRIPDGRVILMQPLQSGGMTGVRLDTDPESDTILELLPIAGAVWETRDDTKLDVPLPDVTVEFVRARSNGDNWSFDVTLSHPDIGWEDYTDGWHVETADGAILGTRILLHPHETEQPFTRSLSGVEVSPDVDEVYIRTHDLVSGYGQETVAIPLSEAVQTEQYEVVR